MKGLGTLINVVTVLAGSGLGLWLGSRLPARTREVLTGGLGVVTLLIGLDMARATGNILIVLGSVLAGGLVGTALDLDGRLEAMGRTVERALLRASRGTRPAVRPNGPGAPSRPKSRWRWPRRERRRGRARGPEPELVPGRGRRSSPPVPARRAAARRPVTRRRDQARCRRGARAPSPGASLSPACSSALDP